MSSKSKTINEIIELKRRKQFDTLWELQLSIYKLKEVLKNTFDSKKNDDIIIQSQYKFIIVNLISITESVCRSSIKGLIDKGDLYLENSKNFFQNKIKIDFESFKYLHNKEFTLGEFISHQISCSSVDDFIYNFNTIFNADFPHLLMNIEKSPSRVQVDRYLDYYKLNYNEIIKDFKQAFELRHIICHEMSNSLVLEYKVVAQILGSINCILSIVTEYIYRKLYPDLLLTYSQQNILYKKINDKLKKELYDLIEKIKSNPINSLGNPINLNLFLESISLWEKHIELMAKSIVDKIENINEKKAIYYEELNSMIEDKIEDLKFEFEEKF